MLPFVLCAVLAFSASVAAYPSLEARAAAPAGHAYRKPGKNDVRSPCPGLNSLANHGWINRSGKNITVPMLIDGGGKGLGMGVDFMSSIGFLALFSPEAPNFQSFNLDELAEHNFPIEHDVSLTRKDYFIDQDDNTFYKPYYDEFISYYKGLTYTTVKTSAAARKNRINYSFKNNPNLDYGPIAFLFGYGETGLYTTTMGMSPLAQTARVDYVKSLFLHERLPYELGWKPSVIPITFNFLGQQAVTTWLADESPIPIAREAFGPGLLAQTVAIQMALAGKKFGVPVPSIPGVTS